MKRIIWTLFLGGALLAFSGCYHAQVVTDKTPSTTVIDNQWAMSFVFGLVPPPVVETAQQCPNGLARVETRISFLNGLVAALSANIITPMHIRVTCAAGPSASLMGPASSSPPRVIVPHEATTDEVVQAFQRAADKAVEAERPVEVQFSR